MRTAYLIVTLTPSYSSFSASSSIFPTSSTITSSPAPISQTSSPVSVASHAQHKTAIIAGSLCGVVVFTFLFLLFTRLSRRRARNRIALPPSDINGLPLPHDSSLYISPENHTASHFRSFAGDNLMLSAFFESVTKNFRGL